MNRFFLLTLIAFKNESPVYTSATFATDNGSYVNRQEVEDSMKAAGYNGAMITNIIEVSEEDYTDYVRTK